MQKKKKEKIPCPCVEVEHDKGQTGLQCCSWPR